MKQLLTVLTILLALTCCTTEAERTRMRAGLDSINVRNRNDLPFTIEDVQPYVQFFDNHGTPNDRLLAHYLLGLAYYDHGEAAMALQCYHQAIESADTTVGCDFAQLSRVYGQMSHIFLIQGMYQEQLRHLDPSIRYAFKDRDTLAALISMEQKIHAYRMLGNMDSVINLSEKVYHLYKDKGFSRDAAIALGPSMRAYLQNKNYASVRRLMDIYESESGYFDENNQIEPGREVYYNIKGRYYAGIGKTDSAQYYFRKELHDGKDYNNQNAGAIELARLYYHHHQNDSAAKYALYGYDMNDSMYAHQNVQTIERMQAQYDYSRHQEIARKESEKATNRIIYIWICLFVISALLLLLTLAAFLYHSIRQKHKQVRGQYHQALITIQQARADLQRLQLYKDLNKELIAEKEKLISDQSTTIKSLLQNERTSQNLAANSFKETEIYRYFTKLINAGKEPDKSRWVEFQDKMFQAYPNFSELMNKQYEGMTDNEYKICLLIRADFKPVSISAALNISPSTITQTRKKLCYSLFGKAGDSKDFDKLLKKVY